MASYHRVLETFDRSVNDKTIECDYDIHPWDVLVNGARWEGKIRLVGFVDVFFLLAYSGKARFEKGIIIYKDETLIRKRLKEAQKINLVTLKNMGLVASNEKEISAAEDKGQKGPLPNYYKLEDVGLDYTITSVGHEVGFKIEYEADAMKKYVVKVRKGRNQAMKHRIYRGVCQHGVFSLIWDVCRLGLVTQADLIGQFAALSTGGSRVNDVVSKYFGALSVSHDKRDVPLEADRS